MNGPTRQTWADHARVQARNYVVATILVAIVLLVSRASWTEYRHWQLTRADPTAWVEYHGIRYIGEDPAGRAGLGSLRMESDRTIHRPVSMRFIDTLRCRPNPNADFEFVTQNPATEAFSADPDARRTVNWSYNADYPRGRECVIRSTIEATIDGVTHRQQVVSPPFTVGG